MKNTQPIIAIILILLLLNACGTIAKGLGGSKKEGSDEFLVEKKPPLVIPPSFEKLPEPKKESEENTISTKEDTSSIEKIINQNSSTDVNIENNELNDSIEKSIIEKINEQKIKKINSEELVKQTTETTETTETKETGKKKRLFQRIKDKFSKK
tara:strand:- start:2066 stop:2527 length:462 start_codon:yes stop_codon:yes gene_type:complete